MSNYVYGYLIASNMSTVTKDIKQIVEDHGLGLSIKSANDLINFPSCYFPTSNNALVFYVADAVGGNTAQYLLSGLNYVVELDNGLPQKARARYELLCDVIIKIVKLEEVEKLYIALTDNQEIESVTTVSVEKLKEIIINDFIDYGAAPNILYIV